MATYRTREFVDKTTGRKVKRYEAQIRMRGHPQATRTFTRLEDARRWAAETETSIRDGRYQKTAESRKHTLAEAIDRYLDTQMEGRRSAATTKQQLLWWKEKIGAYFLSDVTPAILIEQRDKLAKTKTVRHKKPSPTTLNRYMGTLSNVFTVATDEWEWTTENPTSKIKALKQPRGRVRYLTDDERARLIAAAQNQNPALMPALTMAIYTGMRWGELSWLRWDQVDFERGRVVLDTPDKIKNEERRQVPLAEPVIRVLLQWKAQRRIVSPLLFPSARVTGKPVDLRKAWRAAIRESELENITRHDLRHTTASYIMMSGGTLADVQEILGHLTTEMSRRYSHLSEDHKKAVVDRMATKFKS